MPLDSQNMLQAIKDFPKQCREALGLPQGIAAKGEIKNPKMTLDSQNMLQAIKDFPNQCREALSLPKGLSISNEINNIVIAGMGGSAIGGDLLKVYLSDTNIPVHVSRGYKLPSFANENSLVFAVSYSGNTEETLSSLKDAKEKNAQIIGITSGGKLAIECKNR